MKPIYTPARGQKWHQKSERGITLIMVLIFMVTLSLIAAVGMRGVISGERVVANQFDKASAFQAAESAGREGVAAINAVYMTAAAFPSTTIPGALPLGSNAQFWRTTSDLTATTNCPGTTFIDTTQRFNWKDCATEASTTYVDPQYSTAEKPRYVIEKLPGVPSSTTPGKLDCWYRVTSRATGISKEADVILQVMFSPDYPMAPVPGCK